MIERKDFHLIQTLSDNLLFFCLLAFLPDSWRWCTFKRQAWGSESPQRICWGVWKCDYERLCVELRCISFSFSKHCSLSCSNNFLPFPLFHSIHLLLLNCTLYSRWTSKSLHVIRRCHICEWKWNEWHSDEGWSGKEMVDYVKITYHFINFQNKSFFHFSSMDI